MIVLSVSPKSDGICGQSERLAGGRGLDELDRTLNPLELSASSCLFGIRCLWIFNGYTVVELFVTEVRLVMGILINRWVGESLRKLDIDEGFLGPGGV